MGSGCRVRAEDSGLARIVGDRDRRQFGPPCRLLPGIFHVRLASGDGGIGERQSSRITGLIDDDQNIAFVDELVVLDPNIVNKAGDVRGYSDDVSLDVRVTGPW